MLISTTPTIEGNPIKEYLGLISSEVIVWANVVKDLFAGLTDFFVWRSSAYESALIQGKNEAMDELLTKAKKLGADAGIVPILGFIATLQIFDGIFNVVI